MSENTTIMIEKSVRDELKKFGFKDETYNHILKKLINLAKKEMFIERQKQILETEEFVELKDV